MLTIRILLCIVLGLALSWIVISSVRKGSFSARGGARIDQRARPIRFWLGMIVSALCASLLFVQAWRIAFGG